MKSRLRRYISRFFFFASAILLSLLLIAIISVNIYLTTSKGSIQHTLATYLDQNVSFEDIFFMPPGHIFFVNFSISQRQTPAERQLLFAKRVHCVFSLRDFIQSKDFLISTIYVDNASLDMSEYYFPSEEETAQILNLLSGLAERQTLQLEVKNVKLILPSEVNLPTCIFSAIFNVEPKNLISSSGSLQIKSPFKKFTFQPRGSFFNYRFLGTIGEKTVSIDNLEFTRQNLYTKFWGKLKANSIKLNGFALLHDVFAERKTSLNLIKRAKKVLFKKDEKGFPLIDSSLYDLIIYDIECAIKFLFNGVMIDNFSFSLKNMPFRLKGALYFLGEPHLDLTFSSFFNQPQELRFNNPMWFDMHLKGYLKEGKFRGKTTLDFLRKTRTKRTAQKLESNLEDLAFSYLSPFKLEMKCRQASVFYTSDITTYEIFLKDLIALFNLKNKRYKYIYYNSLLYDGRLQGQARLDIAHFPIRGFFDAKIKEVSANKLESLLIYFHKVQGELSSFLQYQNHPNSELRGAFTIRKGNLNDFIFFKWLADFFNITSLKKVDFDTLRADFIVNNEVASLKNIDLDSEEVTLNGYFTLSEDDLVSSKLSLALSEQFLNTSPKFKSLLRYLGKEASSISFNFRLSGLFEAMNFQWLESDFKKRLQDLLPGWMERGIERKIEKIMEPISSS